MIRVHHLSGSSLAGQKEDFRRGIVRIGRGLRSEVRFSRTKNRLVSNKHAELFVGNEALWIRDLNSRNGTYVNGDLIRKPRIVGPSDEIMFGDGGPCVHAAMVDDVVDCPSPKGGVGLETLRRIVRRSRREQRAVFMRHLGSVVVFFSIAIAIGWYAIEGRSHEEIERASKNSAREAEEVARETASSVAKREAKGIAEERAEKIARKIAIAENGKLRKSFQDAFSRVEPSVYPVFRRQSLGVGRGSINLKGGGTAWVVAPGILATNAHVAATFDQLRTTGGGLVIRTASLPPEDIEVKKVKMHPGYALWAKLKDEYRPVDSGSMDFLRLFPACDVALMYVKSSDAKKLGPPLKLASATTLRGLKRGSPLAFLGYSVEGSTTGAMNRGEASSDVGQLSQSLDFFLERTDPEQRQLLTYNLRTAGGASGSPVFNLDGEVIALHNAGNYKFLGRERISQGTTNAGQRVDLLRSLLSGISRASMKMREAKWRQQFLDAWRRGHQVEQIFRILAFSHVPKFVATNMGSKIFRGLSKKVVHLKPGEQKKIQFQLVNGNAWFVAAMPKDKQFHKIGFKGPVKVAAESWLALMVMRGAGTQRQVELEVFLSRDSKESADVSIGIFQLK